MVTNRKVTGKAMTVPGGVLLGACAALLWTIAAAAILGILIGREILPEQAIGYGSIMILLSASFLGSLLAWGKVKHQRAVVCLSTGAAYLIILLSMTALFFGGQYEAIGVTVLLVLAGCAVVILMGMGQGKGGSRKLHKKYR